MTVAIRVSILIKALNEEEKIARCLAAAVREAKAASGEVILVDSLSTDHTVEIAQTFPIRIVQFKNGVDRSCGAATQLGYQYARGDYLYVLDGDMELQPGFILQALEYLDANRMVAGVGGLIVDVQISTPADRRRLQQYSSIKESKSLDHLGGGGLYRRTAIVEVGYLANRWLKAAEEADLGLQLRSKGWRLMRLPIPSVMHVGHDESGIKMLRRLWNNGRMQAYGVLLRNAFMHPWWWASVRHAWFVFAAPALYLANISLALLLFSIDINMSIVMWASTFFIWGQVFLAIWVKKRIFADVVLAIVAWHFYAIAAAIGFFRKVENPYDPITAHEITNNYTTETY